MKLRYFKNVVTLALSQDKCIGCAKCVEVCPHRVFKLENKKAVFADKNACMECGACQKNCPTEAITVTARMGCAYGIFYEWMESVKHPNGEGQSDKGC